MPGSITVTLSGLTNGPAQEGVLGPDVRTMALAVARVLQAAAAGAYGSTARFSLSYSLTDSLQASGTLTISSGSGAVGGTIAGTAKTVTWGTSDTASAAALAVAINADATIKGFVYATSAAGVVTLTALVPGVAGNRITLVASGTGVTASGATLASGTGADTPSTFTPAALAAL
jgi:phage tail sheath gpL-like